MGKKIFRMGETGKGQATKLAMNLQIAMIYEGFAEALTLATKLGVDSQQLVSLIEATMVRSGVVEYKAPFVLQRDFTPNFPLRLMHKDIRLTLEADILMHQPKREIRREVALQDEWRLIFDDSGPHHRGLDQRHQL